MWLQYLTLVGDLCEIATAAPPAFLMVFRKRFFSFLPPLSSGTRGGHKFNSDTPQVTRAYSSHKELVRIGRNMLLEDWPEGTLENSKDDSPDVMAREERGGERVT